MRAEALRGDRERGAAAGPGGLDEAAAAEAEAAGLPREQREYRVAATGARATLDSAKSLLFHFCNKLPSDRRGAPPAPGRSRALRTRVSAPDHCELSMLRSPPRRHQGGASKPCAQVMQARADLPLLRFLQRDDRNPAQPSAHGTQRERAC
jgi:hypothetical protein